MRRRRAVPLVVLAALLPAAFAACRVELGPRDGDAAAGGGDAVVRVYSSMYKDVIEAIGPALEKELAETSPGTRVEWFQSGSEKIASRLDTEFASGGSTADLLLTSDPAYYERLEHEGLLVPYVSPRSLAHPRSMVDPKGAWGTARISTMVIGVSSKYSGKPPVSFADLTDPRLSRISMGDPLGSGTSFTTVAVLSERLGWDWFRALKAKGTVASGGNASVLQRLDTGEADAGILLLENLLAARARGSRVSIVIPGDGAVVIPGPIALLPHAKRSLPARAVYDALLSPAVQRLIAEKGFMHSPDPEVAPPPGAPTLESLLERSGDAPQADAGLVKSTFDEIFYR